MKVYRDLKFHAIDPQNVDTFIERTRGALPAGWKELPVDDPEFARGLLGRDAVYYLFQRDAFDGRPAAMVSLLRRTGKAEIANIIPASDEVDRIEMDHYNAIIDEFVCFAGPLAQAQGVSIETNAPTTDLGPWLSPTAIKKLESFSALANKSTGSGHPMDAARWFAFIIQSHREQSDLSASTLGRYLVEHDGWSPERAHDLILEYELGRQLLAAYDSEKAR